MTDQEKMNVKLQALKMMQDKMTSDLESFKDTMTMQCSRVIDAVFKTIETHKASSTQATLAAENSSTGEELPAHSPEMS